MLLVDSDDKSRLDVGPILPQKPAYATGIWCHQLTVVQSMLEYIKQQLVCLQQSTKKAHNLVSAK